MKVLLLNGSSNLKGCTYTALEEIAKTLQEEGIDTEIFQIGAEPLRDCIGCGGCSKGNGCVFRDDCVNVSEVRSLCNLHVDSIITDDPVMVQNVISRDSTGETLRSVLDYFIN